MKKRLSRARLRLREDLAETFENTLKRTRPGVAFTAATITLLGVAGPGTAAAASLTTAKATGIAAKAGLAAKLALGGTFLGIASGFAGVAFGLRQSWRKAHDAEERRGLLMLSAAAAALVVVFVLAAPHLDVSPVLAYVAFAAVFNSLYFFWLPHIVARRLAAERAADPEAVTRQRRQRSWAILGGSFGIWMGLAGILHSTPLVAVTLTISAIAALTIRLRS